MPSQTKALPGAWVEAPMTARLVLADGSVIAGYGLGATGSAVGEVCFNTAITGYQEILTDPSYAGQIVTFTFPHIGNIGTNTEDTEMSNLAARSGVRGCVLRAAVTAKFDIVALKTEAKAWPGLDGMDLVPDVTCGQSYTWDEARWVWGKGYPRPGNAEFHVVALDYGLKRNILRCLVSAGCKVTVLPATAKAEDVLARKPDGVFLSNGPGDPAATGKYAVPEIKKLVASGLPVFGICLGHQMLGLALGAKTHKMKQGHHGANHPVKDQTTNKVEITSMNHGFAVDRASLPAGVEETHVSLFDGTNCGLRLQGKPVFSVQYHPEASPGPEDSHYLFVRFANLMRQRKKLPVQPER